MTYKIVQVVHTFFKRLFNFLHPNNKSYVPDVNLQQRQSFFVNVQRKYTTRQTKHTNILWVVSGSIKDKKMISMYAFIVFQTFPTFMNKKLVQTISHCTARLIGQFEERQRFPYQIDRTIDIFDKNTIMTLQNKTVKLKRDNKCVLSSRKRQDLIGLEIMKQNTISYLSCLLIVLLKPPFFNYQLVFAHLEHYPVIQTNKKPTTFT
eukprot:TRINITY_DN7590_c0_g1_i4.p2 TRINITY_DN7590_c0_g1~~TRINITY_DN7590_c0_g1_i4.p2  ORF type:complete len:206 (-),score=-6.86 TRINITY_DN7590_c0_g1_i4:543-1160(-)